MARKNQWTTQMIMDLYQYKFKDKLPTSEIAEKINKSTGAVNRKLKRVDWDSFLENPDNYVNGSSNTRKWTQAEMGLLYAYMEEDKSYGVIAERIGRGRISVERKAQTTDWKAWLAAVGDPENPETIENIDSDDMVEKMVDALVVLSRREVDRLQNIKEKEFRRKVNFETEPLPIPFSQLKKHAEEHLESLGMKNPEEMKMGEGTYIIVGDSHGKFTKNEMFSFLHKVDNHFKPNRIIHLGHILDDDNDISYHWGKFKNLTIVSKIEELHLVQEQRNKFNFNYDIARGCVTLGNDLVVMNQDLISDYVKTPIKSLDGEIFDKKVIVNCHRMEFFPKCSEDGEVAYSASPGALCERHIVRTIKQIDFEDGRHVKQANWAGFSKYRRMKFMNKYWKQGMLVVHVDAKGNHTIIPCLIRKVKNGYATSYFDKIITDKGLRKPTKKIFVTSDAHSPKHRNEVLDMQEQIAKDYKPDIYVNMGDSSDYRVLNHHILDRGGVITGDVVCDAAAVHKVIKRQATWAKKCYIQKGNHERFANDFTEKFPQLTRLLNFDFLCGVNQLGYEIIELKKPLKIGPTTFIHGDLRMFGQSGPKIEKASKTFGDSVFTGDSHFAAIRYGTYVVGLTGELDQDYNEASASPWTHGFGLCNHYDGKSWPTTITIVDDECRINNKLYAPKNPENWELNDYEASLTFNFV